jgi:hypothetical protein
MSGWKKLAIAASTSVTLLALAIVGGGATPVLRSVGGMVVASATAPVPAGMDGHRVSKPGVSPIMMMIGPDWTLSGMTLDGTVTVTCGPFMGGVSGLSSAFIEISGFSGQQFIHAFGTFMPICDGMSHDIPVMASVVTFSSPPASAMAFAFAVACGTDPMSMQFVCATGHAGPTTVSIM